MEDISEKNYTPYKSLEHCQTIEQAQAVISQLQDLVANDKFLNEELSGRSCPIGKPDDLDIFTRTQSHALSTQWMNFKLVSSHGAGKTHDLIILTSVDTRKNEKHVCFFGDEDPTRQANLIISAINKLAYQFIVQDLGKDFESLRDKKGPFPLLPSRKIREFPIYHFYTHTIMSATLPREDFIRHDLEYHKTKGDLGSFNRIKMKPFTCMPAYLKSCVDHYIGFEHVRCQG